MSTYYREKTPKLHDVLFLSRLTARENFIKNERHFDAAYMSSRTIDNPDLQNKWGNIWKEFFSKDPVPLKENHSSFVVTILDKQNKSLEKKSLFILEEFYRVL